jgi:hypothetical protein
MQLRKLPYCFSLCIQHKTQIHLNSDDMHFAESLKNLSCKLLLMEHHIHTHPRNH